MTQCTSPIIIACDFSHKNEVEKLISELSPRDCRLKIGLATFTRFGPDFITQLTERGFEIFLDLKFHDIPQQVALAAKAAADLGVWMITLHALGGERMMTAAKDAIAQSSHKPHLVAVTILTSHSPDELSTLGLHDETEEHVLALAQLAQKSELDGIVCSSHEVKKVKTVLDPNSICVTPGIRLADSPSDDQRRIMTPVDALKAGSDYLVIGRPITQAENPNEVLQKILLDIKS